MTDATPRLKFGLFVPQGWKHDLVDVDPVDHWTVMNGLAQRADAGDVWDSIWVFDHFHTVPEPTDQATHEAWSLMAAFAASTRRIRLGQMCTCLSYRNPAYLAKVATTVDVVSGGRINMGIGAGWYEHEWRAYGYGFPGAGERLARLDEGVQIFRQLWQDGISTFEGKHYQTAGAINRPLPVQEGGIPLWIAGGGERKTLLTAAKYADYTNFDGTLETFTHKSSVLEKHCQDVGRDFASITRSADYNVAIGRDEKEVADRVAARRAVLERHVSAEATEREVAGLSSSLAAGTPEQIVENLKPLLDAGLGYANFYFPEISTDTSGLELFEREVVPALLG
ncbi:F420-dependent oxidoreductase-like protein [Kineococcus rhizosphaerae]|uniref:F420-dependent oxidoreductase-like protein n=1 Tax=Kineococcus rhizosphaerae TaxID=559628 RepID=A0A2T0R8A0_9ACTN|nr:LLM class F420-dependent oxidoreductase [Kineococcus rhizosphaerae]PRY17388.1 F420-dependent oxidoreductase-like protein [Kineococcus rhizosphaerae]